MPRFGFAGLCFALGFCTFAIQQGCAVTGNPTSWIWGVIWFSIAALLILMSIWLWDKTASHHWARKIVLTVAVVGIMMPLSYIPIAKQYRIEHSPQPDPPKVLTAGEIEEIVKRSSHDISPG